MADNYVVKNGLTVGNLKYPGSDGSSGDVLTTDGSGNLSLQTPSGGSTGGGSAERVRVNYNTSFDITSVTDETSGVTTTIENSTDSIISMQFTGHAFPPLSILFYVWDEANTRYTIQTTSEFGSGSIRFVVGNDSNFGNFSSNGPIRLQLDENNLLGLNTIGLGGSTHVYIMMWFQD